MEEVLSPMEACVLGVLESATASTTIEDIMFETRFPRITVETALRSLVDRGFLALSGEAEVDPDVMRFPDDHPLSEIALEWMLGYFTIWKARQGEARLSDFGHHIENVMLTARLIGYEQAVMLIPAHFSLKVEDIAAALLRADAESLWVNPRFVEVEALLRGKAYAFLEIQDLIASVGGDTGANCNC